MWSNGWPRMVTPSLAMQVKSDSASRPGSWTCAKNTSLGGPSRARHCLIRRCRHRSWTSGEPTGEAALQVEEEGLGLEARVEPELIDESGPDALERVLAGPPGI